jgi:hypothetical protein
MRTLQSILIAEKKGEQAHRQAVAMGLKYKGFGYWVDPQTGKVTHKTENDQLVAVEPDVESDKWGGDAPEGEGMPGGAAPGGPPGSFGGMQQQMKQAAAPAPAMGEVLPGQEQKPRDLGKWEPGPDGNNCVKDQPTPESPEADAYVGKTNYMNWTAGPDGDNYSNMDINRMYKGILGKQTSVKEALHESVLDGLMDFAKNGEEPDKPQPVSKGNPGQDLTQNLKQYVSDPNFRMNVKDEDEIGEGAFGQVFNGPKGSVIKKGRIGPGELKAMYAMRNNKNFPTLLNAEFDGPFEEDEDGDIGSGVTAPGTFAMTRAKGRPLDDGIYDMDFDTRRKALANLMAARGHLHQSGIAHNDMHPGNIFVDDDGEVNMLDFGLAESNPLSALVEAFGYGGDEQIRDFMDGDFQFTAALELFDDDELDEDGNNIFHNVRSKMDENREAVLEMMQDDWGIADEEDEDEAFGKDMFLEQMMKGGIRRTPEQLEELTEQYPNLGNGKFVKKLIERLYRGLGSDQENRMSDAFDKRQQDARIIQAANALRKRRGESPIEVKNRNIVPARNLDFDD